MRAITIQHRDVLDLLNQYGVYSADFIHVRQARKLPYEFMANYYGYINCPIFLAPVGHKVEFYGATFGDEYVAIELDIPSHLVRVQKYYDWADFIYFMDSPYEFESNQHQDVFEFGKSVLAQCEKMNDIDAYQITVEELRKEWIVNSTDRLDRLESMHNGSGGNNILKELSLYI
jgi:hypothetical protein